MTTPRPDQQSVTPPDAPPQSLAAQPVRPAEHTPPADHTLRADHNLPADHTLPADHNLPADHTSPAEQTPPTGQAAPTEQPPQPLWAQPFSSQPLPPQPTAHPSRAPIIALTVLAAVLALVTGIFTALYTGARTDRDHTAATRADKERALADLTAQQGLADRILRGNRSRESTLTAEHDLLTRCVDAAKGYFDLPPERSPESARLFRIMYEVCPQV